MSQSLFLIISALGILAALGTVLHRNLVRAALHLVAFFFIIACQFLLLEAEFLAAIQVLVYIGAVAMLMMFGIMLTRNIQGDDTTTVQPFWTLPAVIAGLALFVLLCVGINAKVGPDQLSPWRATQQRPLLTRETAAPPADPRGQAINNMGKAVGDEMMTRFVVPFEVAGLLLTAALVGAIALAYREGDDEPELIKSRVKTGVPGRVATGAGAGARITNGEGSRTEAFIPPAR